MKQGNLLLEELYQKLEREMLQNIGKRLGNGKGVGPGGVIDWQVEKLSQLGELNTEQLRTLAKYSGWTTDELKRFIQENAIATIQEFEINKDLASDGTLLYQGPTETIYKRLDALERNSEELGDLLRTRLLDNSEQLYRNILTEASTEAMLGNTTLHQALVKSATKWAGQGVPLLVDKAGRRWSTEAYISMVVRNTQKDVGNKMQEDRFEEYGANLVEATQHIGSRPSHVEFQGGVYYLKRKVKGYPSLYKDTTYGQGYDGFVTGINCGHKIYMYVPGIGERDLPIQDKEADADIYKESQLQRYHEREIRKAKKELDLLQSMNAGEEEIALAKQKVASGQKNMRNFIDRTNRTRRYNREQIFTSQELARPRKPMTSDALRRAMTDSIREDKNASIIKQATTSRIDLTPKEVKGMTGRLLKEKARDVYIDYYEKFPQARAGKTVEEITNSKLLENENKVLKSDIIDLQEKLKEERGLRHGTFAT